MKNARHHIAAGVTVVALGILATVALASDGSENETRPATRPAAAASPEVFRLHATARREHRGARREDRRENRREDRVAAPVTTAPAAIADDRDASGHGGRGRDHAEDDGTAEVEHEAGEVEDHEDHGGHGRGRGGGGHHDD